MALSDISTDSRVNNVDYFLHVIVRVDGKLEGDFQDSAGTRSWRHVTSLKIVLVSGGLANLSLSLRYTVPIDRALG